MKIKRWMGGCLLALGACQGENSVVGASGTDPLTGTEGPAESGTTTQWTFDLNLWNGPTACLSTTLPVKDGAASCVMAEVIDSGAEHADCTCSGPGRRPVTPAVADLVLSDMAFEGDCANAEDCAAHCLCEVEQLSGDAGAQCQNEEVTDGTMGWCYASPEQGLGHQEAVDECLAGMARRVLAPGLERVSDDDRYYLACQGTERQGEPAKLGETCFVTDEYDPTFANFSSERVNVETRAAACDSGVCLLNHFQGRASCPYGQSQHEAANAPACFVPGSHEPVTVPVVPQLVSRREAQASVCSCRCDGPGDGPFCECPESMACVPLFGDLGLDGQADVEGSYCVPKGTEFDPPQQFRDVCDRTRANCEEGAP